MLRRRRGFSLVELSILLVIAGLMMAGVLSMMPGKNERASRVATKSRLAQIYDAVLAYRELNGYYPCVASRNDLPNTANYGRAALSNCVVDTSTPAGTLRVETSVGSGIYIRIGVVPTRDLLLSDRYMADEYGNRYTYAVMETQTAASTFATTEGAMTLINSAGATLSTAVAFAVVSHGRDGKGAYRDVTGALKIACGASANLDVENCDDDAVFRTADYSETTTAAGYFDDFMKYLKAQSGFRLDGITAVDLVGESLATGDINGDGLEDLIIGAWAANNLKGYAYVIFGKSAVWENPVPLATGGAGDIVDGVQGFRLEATAHNTRLSWHAVGSGDINNDGFDDVIIGAEYGNGNRGYVYVLFGRAGAWAPTYTVAVGPGTLFDGTQGFRLDGVAGNNTWVGHSVASGDFNNDGFDDLMFGAPASNANVGHAHVVFGKAGAWAANTLLTPGPGNLIDGTQGFRVDGVDPDFYLGYKMTSGDINGDGFDDLVLASQFTSTGRAYVIFGRAGAWAATTPLNTGPGNLVDGTQAFRLDQETAFPYESWGSAVDTGDINNDGYDDVIVGAPACSVNTDRYGHAYVIFGKSGAWADITTVDVGPGNLIEGTQGFRITGAVFLDCIGNAVGSGDVNKDGFDDLIIGAQNAPANAKKGHTYVVYGKAGGWAANTVTSTGVGNLIDGTQGFRFDGMTNGDYSGYAVAAGDINGDGFDDIFTSANEANGRRGYVYGIFGRLLGWNAETVPIEPLTMD